MPRRGRSFFSTNRVCSRCLALKDTIVGYTDEVGVTIPPLHPRCRCAIIYDEVEKPRVTTKPKSPQFLINKYEDKLTNYTLHEFIEIGKKLIPTIEKYTGQKTKWIGQIMLNSDGESNKPFECYVFLDERAPIHVLLHELIHSCSAGVYGSRAFINNRWEEELTVHYLSQELATLEKIDVIESEYDSGVELIRQLRTTLGVAKSDLEFASDLVKQSLGERWEWLEEQISDKMNLEGTVEQWENLTIKLEAIRTWIPKERK